MFIMPVEREIVQFAGDVRIPCAQAGRAVIEFTEETGNVHVIPPARNV